LNNTSDTNKRSDVTFFSDLDQTLQYSVNSAKIKGPTANWPDMVVTEINQDKPSGFMTYHAAELLREFAQKHHFVPTTTRTTAQYQRIRFPNIAHEYAITTNGGKILFNGVEDKEWDKHISNDILAGSASVRLIEENFREAITNSDWVLHYGNVDDLFGYFICDVDKRPQEFLDEAHEKAAEWNFKVSVQGRKVYLVPVGLTKGYAVEEVNRRLATDYTIAAGDSNLDRSILELADLPIRPAHGELDKLNYNIPNLVITKEVGIRAGEEIVQLATDVAAKRLS
jgi:hydroxymethylpyrimidine pyrophosphatase-like HAD family hydrolase